MKNTISSKGQVTVPVKIRDRLGLQPGTVVQFEIHRNGVLMKKGGPGRHPVDRAFGTLKLRRSVDALLVEMRGKD